MLGLSVRGPSGYEILWVEVFLHGVVGITGCGGGSQKCVTWLHARRTCSEIPFRFGFECRPVGEGLACTGLTSKAC